MNFDAIERVSQAFAEALGTAFTAASIPGDIYVGPVDDPDAEEAAAVLFLYRLVANADLRSAEHRGARRGPAAAGRRAPGSAAARSLLPAHCRHVADAAASCRRCACSAAPCSR